MSGGDLPTYRELVAAAAKAVGAVNARQLADALGYTGRDEDKPVRNWLSGTNAPNYEGTMRLLQAAGWLNLTGGKRRRPRKEDKKDRATLLTEIEENLRRLREDLL